MALIAKTYNVTPATLWHWLKRNKLMEFIIQILLSNINKELVFSIMRDFRLGGLNPDNYEQFMRFVKKVPNIHEEYFPDSKEINDFMAVNDPSAAFKMKVYLIQHNLVMFNIKPVSKLEVGRIWERANKIIDERIRFCWHPEASESNCTKDTHGNIKISSAHSVQKSRMFRYISDNNLVKQFRNNQFNKNKNVSIKFASTFWGFCDKHDKIFNSIEKDDYINTLQQNFLFAYRAFVHSSHIKIKFSDYYDYGDQARKDIERNRKIFDDAILESHYDKVKTDSIVLEHEYPFFVVSSSDLDFDYYGNEIKHSDYRLEKFYLTIFPQNGKTYVLFSYFEKDSHLYGQIFTQIRERKRIESDLSVLIAGHCENVFFNPSYYEKYIENQEEDRDKLIMQTQFDFVSIDGYGDKEEPVSLTPKIYLENEFNIQLFHK